MIGRDAQHLHDFIHLVDLPTTKHSSQTIRKQLQEKKHKDVFILVVQILILADKIFNDAKQKDVSV